MFTSERATEPWGTELFVWCNVWFGRLLSLGTDVLILAFITRMRDINTEMGRRLADLRRTRSEVLCRVEAQLLLSFAVVLPVIEEGEAEPESPVASESGSPGTGKKPKKRPGHHGRAAQPKHLERVTEFNDVPVDLRTCLLCGETMTTVGHSACEVLDVRPAEFFARRRLDERVACRNDDTIVSAPKPPELVERGKLGTPLLVDSLADKYLEHEPIDRQCLRWVSAGVEYRAANAWARCCRGDRCAVTDRRDDPGADARARATGNGFHGNPRARPGRARRDPAGDDLVLDQRSVGELRVRGAGRLGQRAPLSGRRPRASGPVRRHEHHQLPGACRRATAGVLGARSP
jgi:transposase